MKMHNPPHPGEFIKDVYIDELQISERLIAQKLNISPSTLNRLINGKSSVTPEMSIRLSITLGRSPESWLAMQDRHSLWVASKAMDLSGVEKLEVPA